MQRLLDDASKLSGVKYELGNLADMYNAIHVIQENMGVTGTTAKEASMTFTGSFNAMKASAQNLLGAMATGGDIEGTLEALIESTSTFLLNNAVPMVVRIIKALPKAIKQGIKDVAPTIKEAGGELITALKEGAMALLPSSVSWVLPMLGNIVSTVMPIAQELLGVFQRVGGMIGNSLNGAFGEGGGLLSSFAGAVSSAIPVVESVLTGLIQVVDAIMPIFSLLFEQVAQTMPSVQRIIQSVITAILPIFSRLGAIVEAVMPVTTQAFETFAEIVEMVFPIVSNIITMVLDAVMPIIKAFSGLIQQALPIVTQIIQVFCNIIKTILPVVSQIFTDLGAKLGEVITGIVVPLVQKFGEIFMRIAPAVQNAVEIISSVISIAWSIISPILDVLIAVFEALWQVLEPIIDNMVDKFMWLWEKLEPIFTGLSKGLSKVSDAMNGAKEWLSGTIDTVKSWFGFAYGKDRVPYDNYPAMLHQGERVLTRNQADQYDRVMSTRGVSISGVEQKPTSGGTTTGGTNVTIEKLADTLVIEKEADVDKVVEDMINKLKKLVPNMA